MSEEKKFSEYLQEFGNDIIKTSFPQISSFLADKKADEDKASSKISDTEDKPSSSRRGNSSSVANEMVLDSLGAIDERLKVQSIVKAPNGAFSYWVIFWPFSQPQWP
jgi:hypothetical protein